MFNVLIVEDDKDIRDSMKEVLEIEGYAVTVASNGKEGLAVLQLIDRPCVILLDLMMPVMNGFEFLQVYVNNVTFFSIPVIVVSAVADRHRPATGISGFIKKPIDLDYLLATVEKFCGGPQGVLSPVTESE